MGHHKKNTVNWKFSKDSLKTIGVITTIITITISILTLLISWRVTQHTEQVEETKQLNNYLDKLNEIIIEEKVEKEGEEIIKKKVKKIELTTELKSGLLDYWPSFPFTLRKIKEIDYLTRAYTRNLTPKSKRIILIYLYESGLINHSNAIDDKKSKIEIGLEGVCKKYQEELNNAVATITSYENSSNNTNKPTDKQVNKAKKAITELPYCNLRTNRYDFRDIDINGVFLQRIKLYYSYLDRANFSNAYLHQAKFNGSGLRKANFTNATLTKADFGSPNKRHEKNFTTLTGADFTGADLRGADFTGADLSEANLNDADLKDTVFGDNGCTEDKKKEDLENNKKPTLNCAILHRANLKGAKNIDIDEIKKAYYWEKAKYDSDFRKKLGL